MHESHAKKRRMLAKGQLHTPQHNVRAPLRDHIHPPLPDMRKRDSRTLVFLYPPPPPDRSVRVVDEKQ